MQHLIIHTLTTPITYTEEALLLYAALCKDKPATLLLESADIDAKNNLKSLIIVSSAIKVSAKNEHFSLQALTANGEQILKIPHLTSSANLHNLSNNQLSFTFTTKAQQTVFDGLRLLRSCLPTTELSPYAFFLGGLLSYDLVGTIKSIPSPASTHEDLCFYLAESMIVMDHEAKTGLLLTNIFGDEPMNTQHVTQRFTELNQTIKKLVQHPEPISAPQTREPIAVTELDSAQTFRQTIVDLKEEIKAGLLTQIVPSRRFSLPCADPFKAYCRLKKTNPSPYLFYMQDAHFTLFGASPESALKYCATQRTIELYPIAGTKPRGRINEVLDQDLDKRLELELKTDHKEVAEHMMLVDLARDDLLSVSLPKSCYVADLMKIDRYSHVMHLVSRVVATLRPELDAFDAYMACMNMGTLTGFPKNDAMTRIYTLEKSARGSYGGAVGYMDTQGNLDTCIVIRSAFVQNGQAQVQAGAGITLYSDPEMEVKETQNKARAMIDAIVFAHNQ